jgi:hypothetical protein
MTIESREGEAPAEPHMVPVCHCLPAIRKMRNRIEALLAITRSAKLGGKQCILR